MLVYERYDDSYAYVTFVNNSKQYWRVEFTSSARALISEQGELELNSFDIPAYTAQIFKTERNNYIYF